MGVVIPAVGRFEGDPWVVWSFEHDAWWAPWRCGYVRELARAGRYTERDARQIEAQANVVRINEWALPLREAERWGRPSALIPSS